MTKSKPTRTPSPPSDPQASTAVCCTCATLLSKTKVPYDPVSEKPLFYTRRLPCCGRDICALCQHTNPRFQSYCPFCQISSGPSALPPDGLRLPPSYSKSGPETSGGEGGEDAPPAYDELSSRTQMQQRRVDGQSQNTAPPSQEETEDTVHFVGLDDTLASLSIAYGVPAAVLRAHNNVFSDGLITARKWVLIPRSHYDGPPLSVPPDPDEEERKTKLRRWMVATKCADYAVATLYLKASDYQLDVAVQAFKADEEWERRNPLEGQGKGKEKEKRRSRLGRGGSLAGQLS
ncbi:hypothetical protein LTR84_006569 [Exophiala bonariae]|uniref:LysM domain-containing protein n=1 Tax=Exophiala bonariae TaxID=1690606 RepID=A0AAV9N0F5_9EURO|nr:hypothetical protein LTR84_006569 [Exophiala bonariae]